MDFHIPLIYRVNCNSTYSKWTVRNWLSHFFYIYTFLSPTHFPPLHLFKYVLFALLQSLFVAWSTEHLGEGKGRIRGFLYDLGHESRENSNLGSSAAARWNLFCQSIVWKRDFPAISTEWYVMCGPAIVLI